MNWRIRESLSAHGFRQWQLADFLRISEAKLSRQLSRKELPEAEVKTLLSAIDRMAAERNQKYRKAGF